MNSAIIYRPELRQYTGSISGAILLSQIYYWWSKNEGPFYKFRCPCDHPLYKPGDSWTEELGFNPKEFDNALKKIGFKTSKNRAEKHDKPVEYWTTWQRVTYFSITDEFKTILQSICNPDLSKKQVENPELPKGQLANPPNGIYLNDQTAFSYPPKGELANPPNGNYLIPQTGNSYFPKGTLVPIIHRLPETTAAASGGCFSLDNIFPLIPVSVSLDREKWLEKQSEKYGPDYLREKIVYSNQQVRDKNKYWVYLSKALECDYGHGFLDTEQAQLEAQKRREQAEHERAAAQKRREQAQLEAQLEQAAVDFNKLPPEAQEVIRGEFVERANQFEKKRIQKLSVPNSTQNKSFLIFCAKKLSNVPVVSALIR